jgi:hypothetical protein
MLQQIRSGHTVIEEAGVWKTATWKDKFVRLLQPGTAAAQDGKIAELFIAQLAQQSNPCPQVLAAATQFSKTYKSTNDAFKRLENTLFAHKCHRTLSLSLRSLIQADGSASHSLLAIIKSNFLHHGIAKANEGDKASAILVKGDEVFIRAKKGQSFLERADHAQLILHALPKSHPDRPLIKQLCKALFKKPLNSTLIADLQAQLKGSNYTYLPLEKFATDKKGAFLSHAYLAHGMQKHHVSQWKSVQPAFIEKSLDATYKLRVVTRLPEYAFATSWTGFAHCIISKLFDFRAHGHSWLQLVEPIYDQSQQFTGQQRVIDIGYYFHPVDKHKRFQNADPMSKMPIPKEQIVVEETPISKTAFHKGVHYLNQVQAMMRTPNRKLNEAPPSQSLKAADREKIVFIYKSTLKGTCLSFANAVKKTLTGIEADSRSTLRQQIFPKRNYKLWDRLDTLVDRTYLLKRLIAPVRFFSRMELPFWVKSDKAATCSSSAL